MKAIESAHLWMATSVSLLCIIFYTTKKKNGGNTFNWLVHVYLTQLNKLFNFFMNFLSVCVGVGWGMYM